VFGVSWTSAIPGPYRAPFAIPAIPFSGSTGNDVHAHGKVFRYRLVCKKTRFKGDPALQYSSVLRAPLFGSALQHLKMKERAFLGVVPEGGHLPTPLTLCGNETPSPLISFNPSDSSIPIRTFHVVSTLRNLVSERGLT